MENKLIPIEKDGTRVMTTEQLSEVYGTDINNIQVNFKNHKDNFIEGKHYFLLKGEALKEFKRYLNDIHTPINKFSSSFYLWTERGASRHCKILDTDKAWEQFDNLEDTYFKVKEKQQVITSTGLEPQVLQLAQGMQIIGQVIQGIQITMNNMQTFVVDSIKSKDLQIDTITELVGFRTKNKRVLGTLLKEKLSDLTNENVVATDEIYIKTKNKIFSDNKVCLWEDIPVNRFNKVHAYIDTLEKDDVVGY